MSKCKFPSEIDKLYLDALEKNINLEVPDSAWDVVYIDGAKCKGCFSTRLQKTTGYNGEDYYELRCFLEMPKCQCGGCRVLCGHSTVMFKGKSVSWTIKEEEETRHPSCRKFSIVKKDCDEC